MISGWMVGCGGLIIPFRSAKNNSPRISKHEFSFYNLSSLLGNLNNREINYIFVHEERKKIKQNKFIDYFFNLIMFTIQ